MAAAQAADVFGPQAVRTRRLTSDEADLGRALFFDTRLSNPMGQSCATCHQPEHAFAEQLATSHGAVATRIGSRNAPTLMYAALVPPPRDNPASPLVEIDDAGQIGGLFLDGRAKVFEEQVRGPLFNPLEMNLSGPAELAQRLREGPQADRLRARLSPGREQDDEAWTAAAAAALAAFMREPLFMPFDSRVDRYIAGDKGALTPQEVAGFDLFQSSRSRCTVCHTFDGTLTPRPPFTDHSYVNIGLPQPKDMPPDPGQGKITGKATDLGRFRVPTLRNVAATGPWMHDGSFQSLADVVAFYNTRDVDRTRWAATPYPQTQSHAELGHLRLSKEEEADLVAFLTALTDRGYEPAGSPPIAAPDSAP